jgi:hypothetical protein
MRIEYSPFRLSLFWASAWDPLNQKKTKTFHDIKSHQWIYHVGYTSSHTNTEVKQHWAWIILGWETLQRISGSAGTYLLPPADRVQSFQTFFVSIK